MLVYARRCVCISKGVVYACGFCIYLCGLFGVRYPSKEWKSLGTFHARDERLVQVFPIQHSAIFSKYLRIDMLSHFGTEHYCPLTVLRSLFWLILLLQHCNACY